MIRILVEAVNEFYRFLMRQILLIATTLLILCCKNQHATTEASVKDSVILKQTKAADTTEQPTIQFTRSQKIHFLDSVIAMNLQSLKDSITFDEDSIFQSRQKLMISLSAKNFEHLKSACSRGKMDFESAKRIFPGFNDTSFTISSNDSVIVELYWFANDKNSFEEYAVSVGSDDWSNLVYFFKKNQLIAFHDIYHRYGLEIKHFKDEDGRTVIYYKQNFGSGSGIWQFNYYFYKYYDNTLIPVLNVLENGNYTWPGPRTYWLETFVVNERPLKLKFVYYFFFKDGDENDMLNDSTTVVFNFDQTKRLYQGSYSGSKINPDKIITYYLGDNEFIFINAYQKELRNWIKGQDKIKSERALNYLNEVMNYERTFANK